MPTLFGGRLSKVSNSTQGQDTISRIVGWPPQPSASQTHTLSSAIVRYPLARKLCHGSMLFRTTEHVSGGGACTAGAKSVTPHTRWKWRPAPPCCGVFAALCDCEPTPGTQVFATVRWGLSTSPVGHCPCRACAGPRGHTLKRFARGTTAYKGT